MQTKLFNTALNIQQNLTKTVPKWATCNPYTLSGSNPHTLQNLVSGQWIPSQSYTNIVDPFLSSEFLKCPEAKGEELVPFIENTLKVPKSGLHNPFKRPERYTQYGDICFRIAEGLRKPEVSHYFSALVQRVMPKSFPQTEGEVLVTRRFFENFAGDNCRFLVRSFGVSGDHSGQQTFGYRWPFGSVAIICPFNFPIEIPCLQLFGALITGNKPLLKVDSKVSVVMEQFLRFAIECGLPAEDVDFLNCGPREMQEVIEKGCFRVIQFTGSSKVAEHLSTITRGKVKIEDAGFDWKLLGPDVPDVQQRSYVAWQCDQDAYAASGQKCSAQSIIYMHENWGKTDFLEQLKSLATRRTTEELTVGPVLTWNNKQIEDHVRKVLELEGAKLLFGGKKLPNTNIPECYGSYEPTAIFVPLNQFENHFELLTTELFGPFQIVTEYKDSQLEKVLQHLERMEHHLTAAVVSNDVRFLNKVAGNTVNGVTYTGIRARTTGAPQNHFFGPCGDPRGAGIGTPEAILSVWTSPREIITDIGPLPENWQTPRAT